MQTRGMRGRKPLRDGKETPENLAEAVTPLSLSGLHFLFQAEQPQFVRKKAEGRGWDLRTGHCGGGAKLSQAVPLSAVRAGSLF